ncbi:MAG: hypothetical protein ACRDHP_18405, partial [Ktedonobacterales bacterium]
ALLLTLRGRTVQQMTEALHSRWSAEAEGQPLDAPPASEGAAPLRAEGFYAAGDALEGFDVTYTPPEVDGALLLRLGKPPFAGAGEDPIPPLLGAYQRVTEAALKAAARTRRSGTRIRKV